VPDIKENIKTTVMETKIKVKEILNKYIFDKSIWDTAPENPNIIKDLKINSARIVDIVLDIEDQFDIEIDDESLENIFTLNDIIDIIAKKQA